MKNEDKILIYKRMLMSSKLTDSQRQTFEEEVERLEAENTPRDFQAKRDLLEYKKAAKLEAKGKKLEDIERMIKELVESSKRRKDN